MERWLDRNKGLTLTRSIDNDLVEINVSQNAKKPKSRISYEPDNYVGRILDRLDRNYRIRPIGELPGKVVALHLLSDPQEAARLPIRGKAGRLRTRNGACLRRRGSLRL